MAHEFDMYEFIDPAEAKAKGVSDRVIRIGEAQLAKFRTLLTALHARAIHQVEQRFKDMDALTAIEREELNHTSASTDRHLSALVADLINAEGAALVFPGRFFSIRGVLDTAKPYLHAPYDAGNTFIFYHLYFGDDQT